MKLYPDHEVSRVALFVFPIVKFIVYRLLKGVKVVNANQ